MCTVTGKPAIAIRTVGLVCLSHENEFGEGKCAYNRTSRVGVCTQSITKLKLNNAERQNPIWCARSHRNSQELLDPSRVQRADVH
jgi:hypothetical protein